MRKVKETEIKIDRHIPIPTVMRRYPFEQMIVGDSFAVPAEDRLRVRYAASGFRARHEPSQKFSIMKHNGGYRCWRVK